MKTHKVSYHEAATELEAHVVRPNVDGRRPAVLVLHGWAGQTDFERERARILAELGYVGIALDTYGKGVLGATRDECGALMGPFMQDRAALKRRLLAGVAAARQSDGVDPERIAAIGYCFGGLCALDLARSGADVRGVVSLHGLFKPTGLPAQPVKAKVLALHGYADPMVPPGDVQQLAEEFTYAKVDFQIHVYGLTMHAFTQPGANDASFGTVYSARADARSWASTQAFLSEVQAA